MTTPENKTPKRTSATTGELPGDTVVTTPAAPMGAEPSTAAMGAMDGDQDRREQLRGKATELKAKAESKARSAAEEGKAKASETLGSVSRATRDAAEKLKGGQAEPLAAYATDAADAIDGFARRMNEKSVDELLDDAREIVRRAPVLFIGIAAAAGFALSRFLKATARRNGHDRDRDHSRPLTTGNDLQFGSGAAHNDAAEHNPTGYHA